MNQNVMRSLSYDVYLISTHIIGYPKTYLPESKRTGQLARTSLAMKVDCLIPTACLLHDCYLELL